VIVIANIHQGWSKVAAFLFITVIPWPALAVACLRIRLFTNRRVRSVVQRIVDDVAGDLQQRAALEGLSRNK
jgi:hypothetical protein